MKNLEPAVKAYDLTISSQARALEKGWVASIQNKDWFRDPAFRNYEDGVSVVIPSYLSSSTILRTVRSLLHQELQYHSFEVIIILNGPDDGTEEKLQSFKSGHPYFNLRIYHSSIASAGLARNLGISLARRTYTTFIDADDEVAPGFLKTLLENSSGGGIVVAPIVNVKETGEIETDNSINLRIRGLAGSSVSVADVPWVLGFNACKLVPTELLARFRYEEGLGSGEDLVFFAHLLTFPDLSVSFPTTREDSAYIRHLTGHSVSRRKTSFDFNVKQRVDCVSALKRIVVPLESAAALNSLVRSQLGFVCRYLDSNPSGADSLEDYLSAIGFNDFPWEALNTGKAKDLVISYCYAPYSDTSAVVASKAVAERRRIVDVISNNMSSVRQSDESLNFLSGRWVSSNTVVDTPPSFSNWGLISQFAEEALSITEKKAAEVGGYDTMYSRALWVGSHVAAALYKNRHFETTWTAEFSDPLRFGVEGEPRAGALHDNRVSDILHRVLNVRGYGSLRIDSLFDLVEASTFILADDVVFTNNSQMSFMLQGYPSSLRRLVEDKATVRPHPVPPPSAYELVTTDYNLDPSVFNIGYFGNFYSNRGLDDVLTALLNLPSDLEDRVILHVFCSQTSEARKTVEAWGLRRLVRVNPYLPYMEFLNASKLFDALLVIDVTRTAGLSVNPFLPSKYSDYKGSGTPIWGIVDPGSPLSNLDLEFESPVGDVPAAIAQIRRMLQ